MPTRLTQTIVDRAASDHPPGTQLYDAEMSGLRIVVGRRGASYRLVGRINDRTGRYVTMTIGRCDDVALDDARSRAAQLRIALRRGDDPRTPRAAVPTLADALDRYLDARGDELRPKTRAWYRAKLDGPLAPLRKLPVDSIDRERVRSLHETITRRRGRYAANGAMRVLKLVINDAARTHDLPPNPVSRGVRMNRERPRDWALGPDEMPEFWRRLDAMENRTRRACWLTMLLTGLRSGDARSMRWESLDADGVLFVPSPKGGEARSFSLPLPALLLRELNALRTDGPDSVFVFPAGTRSGHLENLRRSVPFPYAPHQMRHTYRTHALEAGVDFQTVTLLMNHSDGHVSFNYVTRAHLLGHLREAQEAVCRHLRDFSRG